MTGEELIKGYKSDDHIWNNRKKALRNSMGCSEYWYYDEYAICRTFSEEEILGMSEKEIDNLVRLANSISEVLLLKLLK